MRKLLSLIIVALFAVTACAQNTGNGNAASKETQKENKGVIWETGTLMQALNKAEKEGKKLVFLDCYASWCGPCKYMANSVFTTKEAGDYFNRKFVNIKIDMEKGEGVNLARQFRIQGYPTFIILDSKGKELGRIVGGAEINEFIMRVEGIIAQ